jgi:hypothetical protein
MSSRGRVKVHITARYKASVYNLQKIMSIDTPHAGDFIFVDQSTSDFFKVDKVIHRDEHYPMVLLEPAELGEGQLRGYLIHLEASGWQYI